MSDERLRQISALNPGQDVSELLAEIDRLRQELHESCEDVRDIQQERDSLAKQLEDKAGLYFCGCSLCEQRRRQAKSVLKDDINE